MNSIPSPRFTSSRVSPQAATREEVMPEVTVVIPCLNEADTIAICVRKAWQAMGAFQIHGEIIVADNGSVDDSSLLAEQNGARVVYVENKGYGSALMGGIESARGRFIIMGDADDSYDFSEIPLFVEKLREGFDLVQGCRLPSGGGKVLTGAMPWLHRWWGNPMFSWLVRIWFGAPIHDAYCGMRGFTKSLYQRLDQRCTGMEFATEMIIKASLYQAKIAEVPITLHPDGRKAHSPHLRTFRDGWRTLRIFLMYCPRWLFLLPGLALILLGVIGYGIGLSGYSIQQIALINGESVTFGMHSVVVGSLAILCGYQSILFALFTKTFAVSEGLLPVDHRLERFFEVVSLEKVVVIAVTAMVFGLAMLVGAVNQWRLAHFGQLDYASTMRLVVPGATLIALGFQTMLSGFFVSILGMKRR